ncbi:MAG: hypothetical protein AAFR21_02135 [Pseudomonadota bacterium]
MRSRNEEVRPPETYLAGIVGFDRFAFLLWLADQGNQIASGIAFTLAWLVAGLLIGKAAYVDEW